MIIYIIIKPRELNLCSDIYEMSVSAIPDTAVSATSVTFILLVYSSNLYEVR
jgi:hypothetical protein